MRLDWNGDTVFRKVAEASALGVDRTMSKAVERAKRIHPWVSKTGFLESSIMIFSPAVMVGDRVGGRWGANANYSLYVEVGTSRIGPRAQARVEASSGMWTIPSPLPQAGETVVQTFTILPPGRGYGYRTIQQPSLGTGPLMGAKPYLRPSASAEYALLPLRIAQAYRGLTLS